MPPQTIKFSPPEKYFNRQQSNKKNFLPKPSPRFPTSSSPLMDDVDPKILIGIDDSPKIFESEDDIIQKRVEQKVA